MSAKRILKYFIFLLLSIFLLFVFFFFIVLMGVFGPLPNKEELSSIKNEEASLIYSADNFIIGKIFAENRTNVKWEDIPEHFKKALIATEDRRFFIHKGYDTKSYFRVFIKSILLNDNSGGGSTITQQLVKNLYGRKDHGFLTIPVNKLKEIIIARRLEDVFSKEELLLLYLNSVPFGEDIYGVESAARRFFSKPVSELKIEESAVLVGMLKANTRYNPVLNPKNSKNRRNLVLNLMVREKYLNSQVSDSLKKLPLKLNYEKENLFPAGYFVYQVKKRITEIVDSINSSQNIHYDLEKDGLRIYTTLNMKVQEYAEKAVTKHLTVMQQKLDKELESRKIKKTWYSKLEKHLKNDTLKKKMNWFSWKGIQSVEATTVDSLWHYYKMLHGAVLITDPRTGAIISWVGGNNFQMLPYDMVLAHRQIASAFKPFLYATALEQGIEPCTYLENSKIKYEEFENWEPENYDKQSTSDSTVALWYALIHSMNLPSVDLYFRVGREALLNTCEKLQFPGFAEDEPSVALGTLDLSLIQTVKAYGAFANHGEMKDVLMITKITDAKGNLIFEIKSTEATQVFSNSTAETLTAILQQVINRGTAAGIRGKYEIRSDLAGKTGTSQNYTDAWFFAYTPDIVIGTWVGAATPEVHFFSRNGSGAYLAMPIVADILKKIEDNQGFRKKYLTSFGFSEDVYSFLQCDPYRQTGIKGFFNRLFRREVKVERDTALQKGKSEKPKNKEERGIKSFFKRIFKQKE